MRINTNMGAFNALRNLGTNTISAEKSLAKLSSGFRINRAADDAAGLAVSEKMRAQMRGINMAIRNTQDAVSLVQTAEGGASKIQDMTQRMRELAVQAGSDTLQDSDRAKLQEEFAALRSEIDRSAAAVTFNGRKLINGESGDKIAATAGGSYLTNLAASGLSSNITGTKNYNVSWAALAVAQVQKTTAGTYDNAGVAAAVTWAAASVLDATVFQGDLTGGETLTFTQAGKTVVVDFDATDTSATGAAANTQVKDLTASQFIDYVNAKAADAGADMRLEWDSGATQIALKANAAGTGSAVAVGSSGFATNVTFGFSQTTAAADAASVAITDAATGAALTAGTDFTVNGNTVTGKAGTIFQGVSFAVNTAGQSATVQLSKNELTFQVGANSGETISAGLGNLTVSSLALSAVAIDSRSNAQSALTSLDSALSTISSERSKMGALQNRLENTIANLQTQSENLTAAESRIRDVDMAAEMASFTKFQVLTQASTAMLAQANQQAQTVLQLLR